MDGKKWVGCVTDFLLELRSEEIPARMQDKAREDLARLFVAELDKAGLKAAEITTYATPRRLVLIASKLPLETPAVSDEIKGPKSSAPPQALEGFLRKTGLRQDQLIDRDGIYFAVIDKPGRATATILAEAVSHIVHAFPWPKSQRWGAASATTESLRWVRPLQGIIALLGDDVVDVEVSGVASGSTTTGHRFHHQGEVTIGNAADYMVKLRAAHVIVDQEERRAIIRAGAEKAASDAGLALVPDEGLVNENSGLTEWPVPMLGRFDPAFLAVPQEVIQLTARVNQKYFICRDAAGKLANAFVCTANIAANDGGAAIVAGNEKVLAARLSDAKFFWEQDLKIALETQSAKLAQIIFHEKLGTVSDKVERVAALARWLVEQDIVKGVSADDAERAARLAKSDLVTGMVGEFPELQGVMGGYYARAQGEKDVVADAVRDHYKPVGPTDDVPLAPVSVAVSLADKLDTLACFFAINQGPTGSKDPFALRRAGLGVIRLALANGLRFEVDIAASNALDGGLLRRLSKSGAASDYNGAAATDVLAFLVDRLQVQQRELGVRHDLVSAISDSDLVRLLARVKALQAFVTTDEGSNLLAGYKRAANILKASDGVDAFAPAPPSLTGEEATLKAALDKAEPTADGAVGAEDFEGAMAALASLRKPIDSFFEGVMVNDPDPDKRAFRLGLLARFRDAVHRVADFSRIEG
ncbi:MAG: glycine--tRNA ligase subunit beta [Sphingorhabdus sp.]